VRPRPVVILYGRERQALIALRSLGRAGIPVFVADPDGDIPAARSRWCAGTAPIPEVGADAGAFVDVVIELCESVGFPVLITSHDGAIEALRSRRSEIERVASLALGPEPAVSIAINKQATLAVARDLGIEVPVTRKVTDVDQVPETIDELGLPLVIKPVVSWINRRSGGWGTGPSVATTAEDALAQIKRLIDGGVPALAQSWLSGSREAVSVFYASDLVWAAFAVKSQRMYPVIGGDSVVRETIAIPADIGPLSEALVRKIGLEGYAEVEFRRDGEGRPFLMEINPRLNAGVEVAVRAGVDVPLMFYRWAAGQPLRAELDYRAGQRMRWLEGDVMWLAEALRRPEQPDAPRRVAAVARFIADFARPTGYDYWNRRDLRPALCQATRSLRRTRAAIARRPIRR